MEFTRAEHEANIAFVKQKVKETYCQRGYFVQRVAYCHGSTYEATIRSPGDFVQYVRMDVPEHKL